MTRKDSVRAAADSAKDSVRHAADAVAPYADKAAEAKDKAAHLAQEARTRLAPKVSHAAHTAADQARVQFDAHVAPRVEQARSHVPPRVDHAAHEAAARTRRAARQAADFSRPRVEHAVAVAGPVREEAAARGAAALAALRGQVTPEQIGQLARRNERRARAGRLAKRLAVLGVLAAGAVAVWKWWDKQANPDWLVEPPAATEVPDRAPLTSVDGSAQASLDPEVQAKQAEAEAEGREERG
ncbi:MULTISPECIES: DUF5324 family protein [Streptomyces]|uniref:Nosiheptide resistance regulatory protein n=1 Tax=Streptomyces alboflavus TaxID=67267 RepID=A0A1Z1WEQ1_9ACTN|nr:DUF5324 family protein [Streptomyces alboflavus]ARX84926.1 nosiheptide resistance regulatory protein [Streptomyces alboflavus]